MESKFIASFMKALLVVAAISALGACAAIGTSIDKSELDVQTKASESIFLEPVRPDRRIIFVSVRNTSDKALALKPKIIARLTSSGYQITQDPDKAQFMLQANVLKVGRDNQDRSDSYVESGFSGAVLGNAVSNNNNGKGIVFGALLGVVADAMIDDTLFTMVTDLQVRERPRNNETITQKQRATNTQGSNTSVQESSNLSSVEWKTYRTRIVSTANQVNLEFEDALPALEDGLVRSISGLFAE